MQINPLRRINRGSLYIVCKVKMNINSKIPKINDLMRSQVLFSKLIYTSLPKARRELQRRRQNNSLDFFLTKELPDGLPNIFERGNFAFLSRDIATPNFEAIFFLEKVSSLKEFTPVFWEYLQDKFTPNINIVKYYLGILHFYFGKGRHGGIKADCFKVIDYNLNDGKKICDIQTLWGADFVEFHHNLLHAYLESHSKSAILFDASPWYAKIGHGIKNYYKKALMIFLKTGILFENFNLEDKFERSFIENVFLPAFLDIYHETGCKPLIVNLDEIMSAYQETWHFYPSELLDFLKSNHHGIIKLWKLHVREQRNTVRSFIIRTLSHFS